MGEYKPFTVVLDPDPDCGFPVGAVLTPNDVKSMQAMGHFTDKTILERFGIRYQVKTDKSAPWFKRYRHKQELVLVDQTNDLPMFQQLDSLDV